MTTTVALGTKASSGSTASGAVILYVGSISPANPNITTSISPNSFDIGTSATNYSILTVATALPTPANTYTIYVVGCTNPASGGVNCVPITNTFTLTVASAVANAFSMSQSSASMSSTAGIATNVSVTVSYLDYSATISGTVTNGVTVLPAGTGVTASLNSLYAPITNNFGTTNLATKVILFVPLPMFYRARYLSRSSSAARRCQLVMRQQPRPRRCLGHQHLHGDRYELLLAFRFALLRHRVPGRHHKPQRHRVAH